MVQSLKWLKATSYARTRSSNVGGHSKTQNSVFREASDDCEVGKNLRLKSAKKCVTEGHGKGCREAFWLEVGILRGVVVGLQEELSCTAMEGHYALPCANEARDHLPFKRHFNLQRSPTTFLNW